MSAIVDQPPKIRQGRIHLKESLAAKKAKSPEMVKELDTLRQRDPVTELFNRQYFMSELETAVAGAADGKGAQSMLLLEADN